ncbi:M48 family metalloprotease [Ferrovibrio terrae]|uniref:M48 family metalloprotease n=1 Tax=Ferrovibrio terrae TaxID=2594003 RepID=UPI003137E09B
MIASARRAPSRRHVLRGLCACSLVGLTACNATTGNEPPLAAGYRPSAGTDEGGLWHSVEKIERETARSRYRIRDAELNRYLEEIITRLSPEFHADMRVYLLRTPYFNASMYPNGMMNVWTGLMLRAKDEAQLAAVLGHEIGHYTQRHSLSRFRDAKARNDFSVFLNMGLAAAGVGAVGNLTNLMLVAGMFAYSREHEREADDVGVTLMTKAGYRPMAASEIWQQLIDESEADKDRRSQSLMFASHPAEQERMATLKAKAEQLGNGGEGFADRYREKIRSIRFMMLEDELRLRQYDRSLVLIQRLQKETPGDGELIYCEAEIYRLREGKDDLKLAETTYERSVQAANPPPQAWRSLGLIQRRDGRHDAAVQSFRKYLDLRPDAEDRAIITSYMEKAA